MFLEAIKMESLNAQKIGGFDMHFLHELSCEYECPVCKLALREPILTSCGHRLCFSCSEEIRKRNNGSLKCPLDNSDLNSNGIFRDKAIERNILELDVKCNNSIKNCQWSGKLRAFNNHLGSCEYEDVKCFNEQCSTLLLRKELSNHMETKCIYRLVTCQYCNQKILFYEEQTHLENCECVPLYCVNQCGTTILRKEISSHITDRCANTIVPCEYLNIGCNFKGMRKEQDNHANSSIQNHFSMAISKVVANEKEIAILKNEIEMRKEQDSLTKNQFITAISNLENKIALIEKGREIKTTNPNNETVYLRNTISKVNFENCLFLTAIKTMYFTFLVLSQAISAIRRHQQVNISKNR
ncbi:TNF receptor-associated factor 5 isoform X2 [Hydra vulgaris]|uniref:TNF receptor-associated factor 5 isoform X2 n=1 Tax=Hydra vulgaris TaxID=6087 RepID=UPI0032EA8CF2